MIASLVETCKLNDADPRGYFADVITRIVGSHHQSRLDELLPWAYPTIPGAQGRSLSHPTHAGGTSSALFLKRPQRGLGTPLTER